MPILVLDASILIDLSEGDLIDTIFRLDDNIIISHLQVEETKDVTGINYEVLVKLGLKIIEHDGEEVKEVIQLATRFGERHINDLFAYNTAKRRRGILLTGDSGLRKIAVENGVDCHGLLWLIELLVKRDILTYDMGCKSLKAIERAGSFLPKTQVDSLLKKWCTNS